MKLSKNVRGTEIEFEFDDEGNVSFKAGEITGEASPYNRKNVGWGFGLFSYKLAKKFGGHNPNMFVKHEQAQKFFEEARKQRNEFLKEKKAHERQVKQMIMEDTIKIRVRFYEGSPLSGYMPSGIIGGVGEIASEILIELGVAKNVEGWGTLVDDDVVEKLGKEFFYSELLDLVLPRIEEEAKKENIKRDKISKKFELAKRTGKPVLIREVVEECDGSVEECSLDIVKTYAQPDGTTTTKRIHTY